MIGVTVIPQPSVSEEVGVFTAAKRQFQPKYTQGETLPTMSTELGFH